MGFRNAEELIAGLFATALAPNERIEITSTDANTISFYSGDPTEGAPGTIRVESSDLFDALMLAILAPRSVANPDAIRAQLSMRTGRTDGHPVVEIDTGAGELYLTAPKTIASGSVLTNTVGTNGGDLYLQPDTAKVFIPAGTLTVPNIVTGGGPLTLSPASGIVQIPDGTHIKRANPYTPTLQPGWTNYGNGFQPARAFKLPDGTGHLAGVIAGTTASLAFTIPLDYAPPTDVTVPAACSGGKHAQVLVSNEGNVFIQNVDAGVTWVSLQSAWWHITPF